MKFLKLFVNGDTYIPGEDTPRQPKAEFPTQNSVFIMPCNCFLGSILVAAWMLVIHLADFSDAAWSDQNRKSTKKGRHGGSFSNSRKESSSTICRGKGAESCQSTPSPCSGTEAGKANIFIRGKGKETTKKDCNENRGESESGRGKGKGSNIIPSLAPSAIPTLLPTQRHTILPTPPTIEIDLVCPSTQDSGGQGITRLNVDVRGMAGSFQVFYNMFTIPDGMTITYEGMTIFDTGGLVSGSRSFQLTLPPGGTSTFVQVIISAPKAGTAWNFDIGCVLDGTVGSSQAPSFGQSLERSEIPSTTTDIPSTRPTARFKDSSSPSAKPSEQDCWSVFVTTDAGLQQLDTDSFMLQPPVLSQIFTNANAIAFRGDDVWTTSFIPGTTTTTTTLSRYDIGSGNIIETVNLDVIASGVGLGTDPLTQDLIFDVFLDFGDDDQVDDGDLNDDVLTQFPIDLATITRIDVNTGSTTEIANITNSVVSGDIVSFRGEIYASVSGNSLGSSNDNLVRFNDNRSNLVGALPSNSMFGLSRATIDGTTQLWGFDGSGDVYNINVDGDTLPSDLVGSLGVTIYDAASRPC